MNVEELYVLTEWVKKEIVNGRVQDKYQQLLNVMQRNAQPNQQKVSFESEKEELLKSLHSIHLNSLSKDQVNFLDSMKLASHVGNAGAHKIQNVLYKNVIDIATSVQKLQEIVTQINEGIQKNQQLSEGLKGCVIQSENSEPENAIIRVTFRDEASMETITDFKDWGRKWHLIGHGIAKAQGFSAKEIRVIGASRGSIVIEFSTIAAIAGTVSGIILSALKVAEKILDLKKKAAEIRILNLQEQGLAQQLELAADKEKEVSVKSITDEHVKLLKLRPQQDGDKINALNKAVTELINFIEKGGEIDIVAPEEDIDEEGEVIEDEYTSIRHQAEEIRQLESQLKLIEDQSEGKDDE